MKRREDLSRPRSGRRFGIHYDPDAFGNFSEGIARFLGTARFLVIQTIVVILWISFNLVWGLNIGNIREGGWDPYPFILLNLAFSLQAAYAAPLILLAQNRQEARDRAALESDRQVYARTQADAEYLAREVASIRLSITSAVTTTELEERLDDVVRRDISRLADAVEDLSRRLGPAGPPPTAS